MLIFKKFKRISSKSVEFEEIPLNIKMFGPFVVYVIQSTTVIYLVLTLSWKISLQPLKIMLKECSSEKDLKDYLGQNFPILVLCQELTVCPQALPQTCWVRIGMGETQESIF